MVRTRFAPSPTGYLHIGGVRTALFNWLFARRRGGRFILRIDDTDQERNLDKALEPILRGFRWLGIDWDEGPGVEGAHGPYFQSRRGNLYQEAVDKLVEAGQAYHDYATPEEVQAEREAAQAAKRRFVYSRRCMADTPERRRELEAQGRQGVVRLKMPRDGACRFTDAIRGEMAFEWAAEQDHVIQRADGSCLYHLASVVDDHHMAISHVIRAEEHLSNTPRQIFIARGLGYDLPAYAHLPFVAEPGSRTKLSKRKLDKYLKHADFARVAEHGRAIAEALGLSMAPETFSPVVVDFYQRTGYLPDALVNALLLLGWALDDRTEIFTRQEMIDAFSLERVSKSPASFDPRKLWAFQSRYMQALSVAERANQARPFLEAAGLLPSPAPPEARRTLEAVVEAAGDRIVVAGDILEYAGFFMEDAALPYDEKAFDKRLRRPPEAADLLAGFRDRLAGLEPFTAASVEEALNAFTAERGVKIGQVIHALRVALTGKGVGFGLFEAAAILGRGRCVSRIDRALARLEPGGGSAGA